MNENGSDHDAFELCESEHPFEPASPETMFGAYSVLSPGVEIVLDGRAVSAPIGS